MTAGELFLLEREAIEEVWQLLNADVDPLLEFVSEGEARPTPLGIGLNPLSQEFDQFPLE